jgi:LPXTG-motif cell wall-anchored protein
MDEHQRARLWAHRLHEDIIFNERQNFFLLAESVLAVAYTEALGSTDPKTGVAIVIAGIALVLTLAWLLVNRRQFAIVALVQRRAVAKLPEFAATYGMRSEAISSTKIPAVRFTRLLGNPLTKIVAYSSTKILAFFVPSLVAVMWLALLGWGLHLL